MMSASKRHFLIFSVFMIVLGISVSAYGCLARHIAIVGMISKEWVYSPKNLGEIGPDVFPFYAVLRLEFSSNYSTTIYFRIIGFYGWAYRLASNVTELDLRFTLEELMDWTPGNVKSVYADFSFEPVRTPCAMRFDLMAERSYPRLGQYLSALGIWFLAVGIGSHGYSGLGKRLKEDTTRLSLKLVLIASYFWTFVAIFYVFLGSDPHYLSPFYAAPLMRIIVIPIALSALATFAVLGVVLFNFLVSHKSLSTKLGYLLVFVFLAFLFCAVLLAIDQLFRN